MPFFNELSIFFQKNYLNRHVHLAICSFLFTASTYHSAEKSIHWAYSIWTGAAVFFVYSYPLSSEIFLRPTLLMYRDSRRPAILLLLLSVAAVILMGNNLSAMLLLGFSSLLTLLYFRNAGFLRQPLKTNRILKPLTIALSYTLVCFMVPCLSIVSELTELARLALPKICLIAAVALISDHEDAQSAHSHPKIGYFSVVSAILALATLADMANKAAGFLSHPAFIASQATYFLSWILLLLTYKARGRMFYSFFVDGILALPFLFSFG